MTDDQMKARLGKMDAPALRELARDLGYTERTMYLWAKEPPTKKAIRAALEKALSGGKR